MLGKLFGGIVKFSQTTALGTGGDPTKLIGSEGRKIQNMMILPTKVNPQAVTDSAKQSGQTEAQSYLLAKYSKNRLQSATNYLAILKTRADYAKGMMNVERQVQQIGASHGKAIARHQLGTAETAANLTGYEAEFTRAGETINF